MHAERAALDWPPDLFDSEEQDEPLAGQDHRDTIDSLSYPLRGRLASPTCYVAAELRVHRDPANLRDYREPDILVAFGVADRVRPRYDVWVEGKAPDLVIEVLSPSSIDNKDLTEKRDWYRREGVREYVVLDPSGAFAPEPRLQAWQLGDRPDGSADRRRQVAEDATLWSELIPFGWRLVEDTVLAVDRATGEVFPPIWDVEPRLRQEIALRRAAEEQTRQFAEQTRVVGEQARLALDEVRLARVEVERAAERERRAQADAEAARAEVRQARERVEQEAASRRALEEELRRLRGL